MPLNVALIGFGAIAQEIVKALAKNDEVRVSQILVRPERRSSVQAQLGAKVGVIDSASEVDQNTKLILECAGHEAVRTYAADILKRGIDFGLLSVGALADEAIHQRLQRACLTGQSRLCILPGAIGGIDALAAAGNTLEQVSYSSRKPPMSWSGSPAENTHNLSAITCETEVFSGSARAAAMGFPKNANVVATVALAGVGFERTNVRLIADPKATGNTHTITAKGALFDLFYQTSGSALPDNPKTSALTAMSALRALRNTSPGIAV